MKIKGIIDEDFINYRVPAMYIAFPTCSFKCDKENGSSLCQNAALVKEPDIEVSKEEIIERYLQNPITSAIVLSGLEPFDSEFDLLPFVDCLRRKYRCDDKVVIYTGYTEEELDSGNFGNMSIPKENKIQYWETLKQYGNIVVKFGRFRPHGKTHLDYTLNVYLASENQYAREFKNDSKKN